MARWVIRSRSPTCCPTRSPTTSGAPTPTRSRASPSTTTAPSHSAPLGLAFVTDLPGALGDGALVGVHGSWNRQPPRPPEVTSFPWRDGGLGDQQTLLGGFQDEDGARWGRPVMAVQGPDDAVHVTDDDAGAVYRMVPPGS